MQVLLVIIVLGWLASLPWTVWLIFFGVVLVVLAVCGYFVLNIDDSVSLPWNRRATIDPSYVASLEALVAEAETEADALRSEVERLLAASRAATSEARAGTAATIHRRVGLAENAPEWLVVAARRAYRSALHPDRHPAWAKVEAERRFTEAEGIFDQINALRA